MPAKQPPTWTNDKRKLGDLKKWPDNPRYSTKDDAAAIVESYEDFGQTHLLLISPDNELYDGHQRLDSWLAKYGSDFVVDVRVSSYRLSDRQRRKLVADLHIKATGQWNWDVLAGWGDDLKDWGFDKNTLKEWNNDANNLKEMLAASDSDVGDGDYGGLPTEDRAPFQQMTFTLHDTQAEQVKSALRAAHALGPFAGSPNENSNGNALARICEMFLGQHDNR